MTQLSITNINFINNQRLQNSSIFVQIYSSNTSIIIFLWTIITDI